MKPLPLTLLALLLTAAAWAAAKVNATRVGACPEAQRGVNGLPLRSAQGGPAAAIVKDGVTYVPLRAVSEALGCQVTWDPRAGVLIWSNSPQLPQIPGTLSDQRSDPRAFPPDPRPAIPQPPLPGRP